MTLNHLDRIRRAAGAFSDGYRGMSRCRFCGMWNGSEDYTDGDYRWPSGFAHYLRAHAVKPPQAFIAHVLSRTAPVRPLTSHVQ